MLARTLIGLALAAALAPGLAAQDAPVADSLPSPAAVDELVLPPDHIITLSVEGVPMRFLVTAEANGPARVNPEIAVNLQWRAVFQMLWDYGEGEPLRSGGMYRRFDFAGTEQSLPVIWSPLPATDVAHGVIGIHHLPYKRVTFPLAPPVGEQTVQRFAMKQVGGDRAMTLGTELDADGKKFKVFFVFEQANNLLTAPTANFIATRFDGGFVPGSEGEVMIDFSTKRRVKMMRLGRPLELGDLLIDTFAVRFEDYGKTSNVGEIGPDDPRFNKNEIIVSDRKPRGRPDFLTRIGRNQIAHCSQLTYDLELRELRLTCGTPPP